MENKPNIEQWKDYLVVQASGITNMFDIRTVCSYSKHKLTSNMCFYIFDHYEELEKEYNYSLRDVEDSDIEERMY